MRRHTAFALLSALISPLCCWAGDDGVANERPPLTGDQLAKYWGVDCPQIASTTSDWIEAQLTQNGPDWSGVDWRELELCAVIYNVRESGRYQPCPDYGRTLLALKRLRSGGNESNTDVIGDYLTNCNGRQ